MHNNLRKSIAEREAVRIRIHDRRINPISIMVRICLEFGINPSSRRGTNAQVALLLQKILIPRKAMKTTTILTDKCVFSAVVCIRVSA